MTPWRAQHYAQAGRRAGVPEEVLKNAGEIATRITDSNPSVTPVLTLGHLAHLSGVPYQHLRELVSRQRPDDYRLFKIRKHVPKGRNKHKKAGYRIICVPQPKLMQVQRWIAQNILNHVQSHQASYAYAPGSRHVDAAQLHCKCSWLIKLDVTRFFESITEIQVYRVFQSLGYSALISFELARVCTRARLDRAPSRRWRSRYWAYEEIADYAYPELGYLPQGAPTSPMLSNLAMRDLDQQIMDMCSSQGLVYSRYADDIAISTDECGFSRERARSVVAAVYEIMACHGLSPNMSKTRICSPGSRKVVLGLLVNEEVPRLSRDYRNRLRQHLYYCAKAKIGPVRHAKRRGFASVVGLRHHLDGMIRFAAQIQPEFGERCRAQFDSVEWPL